MKKIYLIITMIAMASIGLGQTSLHNLSFESSGGYTTSVTEFTDNGGDYFIRTDGSNISGESFTNIQGSYYFAAQDTDGDGGPTNLSLIIDDIDISGYNTLQLKVYLAEDDASDANQDWDATTWVHFSSDIDNTGSFSNVLWIEAAGGTNTAPKIDTDYDGLGDGTEISSQFVQFTANISGTGSLIDIKIEFNNLKNGDEDIAIDNIEIVGIINGGNQLPAISNISHTPNSPTSSQSVSVSADITDADGTISSVVLNWGTSSGSLSNPINMTATGDTYTSSSDIPAQANNATVYYEIVATDNDAGVTNSSEQSYFVLDETSIIINEFLADPAADISGDANGDGVRDGSDDEFVELVNSSSTAIDLSNFSLSDAAGVKHIFPSGTILQPDDAVVVFGGGTPTGFDYYDVQTASTGSLSLNNAGDDIIIKDVDDLLVLSITYGSDAGDDQSLTREPDITGSFVKHSVATGSGGSLFSPNKEVDATAFIGISVWDGDQADNNWNTAANWSNGIPTSNMRAVLPTDLSYYPILSSSGPICNSLLMESGTSLIGVDNINVDGYSIVERRIEAYTDENDGFHFLSSPVAAMSIEGSDFAPTEAVDDLYEWDEASNSWLNFYDSFDDTEFETAKGYLVAYNPLKESKFYGDLNTTSSTKNLSFSSGQGEGWNLLGNPYASAIDWDLLTKSMDIDATVYVLKGSDNTYDSWNGSTGDLTDGHIPINNGFFVKAGSSGQSITFNTDDQVQSSSSFLKNSESTTAEHTLKVSIANSDYSNNTYIQFRDDASNEFDNSMDAYKLMGSSNAPQLFTSINDIYYSINCLPFSLNEIQLSMGFVNSIASEYTISATGFESFMDVEFEIFLEDTEEGNIINLETEDYTFTAEAFNYIDRFILHFYGVTSIIEEAVSSSSHIYANDNIVYVKFGQLPTSKSQLKVFNINGQQVYDTEIAPAILSKISLNVSPGIYIIQLKNDDAFTSQKIIIK